MSNSEKEGIRNPPKSDSILPKVNLKIAYYTTDTLSLKKALILSRADKSTGKSKTWIDTEKSRRSVSSEFHFANITFRIMLNRNF